MTTQSLPDPQLPNGYIHAHEFVDGQFSDTGFCAKQSASSRRHLPGMDVLPHLKALGVIFLTLTLVLSNPCLLGSACDSVPECCAKKCGMPQHHNPSPHPVCPGASMAITAASTRVTPEIIQLSQAAGLAYAFRMQDVTSDCKLIPTPVGASFGAEYSPPDKQLLYGSFLI